MNEPLSVAKASIIPSFVSVRACIRRRDAVHTWLLMTSLGCILLAMAVAFGWPVIWYGTIEFFPAILLGFAALVFLASLLPLSLVFLDAAKSGVAFEADRIVIHRSRWRFTEAIFYSFLPRSELAPNMAADTLLEWILRPRRWVIHRDETQRVYLRRYGEGTLLRLFTTTGSIDPFPIGSDRDLAIAGQALIHWHLGTPQRETLLLEGEGIPQDRLVELIEKAPAGFTFDEPDVGRLRLTFRESSAGNFFVVCLVFAVVWTIVAALVLKQMEERPSWIVQAVVLSLGSLSLVVAFGNAAERRQLVMQDDRLKIRRRGYWHARTTTFSAETLTEIRQRATGIRSGGDGPCFWLVELAGQSKPLWTGEETTTQWLAEVVACRLGLPLLRSAYIDSDLGPKLRDPQAEP
ncbi:hypothetical protein CA13_43270 [Planctomycetes bacterium CA13]|uniref:Uncharacterized protein n=1 Tax=Novipirellula herctigrandis TaxID=2527986 RepID=A0A5C5Z6H2_9BACT|nr:hypothetical protein CA13_43270 [Planctomycetes bacterium CA13]